MFKSFGQHRSNTQITHPSIPQKDKEKLVQTTVNSPAKSTFTLEMRFATFRKKISEKSKVIAAYFHDSSIKEIDAKNLVIILGTDFAARQVNDSKTQDILKPIIKEVFGDDITVTYRSRYSLDNNEVLSSATSSKIKLQENIASIEKEERKKILNKPAIADALKVFGGEVTEVLKKNL